LLDRLYQRSDSACIEIETLTGRGEAVSMSPMGVYDQIKKAFQDIVAPEIHALRGDIRLLGQKIDAVDQRLDQKIDGVDERLGQKIDELDQRITQKIDGLDQRLSQKIDGVDQRLTQRIDGIEEKIGGVDQRLGERIDSLRTEMVSMKGELIAEIRRVDVRIDGVERTLGITIDVRERLAALEARLATS